MDWTSQTNNFMNMWNDAQKQMMSNWLTMLSPGTSPIPGFDPSQIMKQAADTWSGLAGGTPERLAGNVMGMPDIMTRSVNLLMKTWQTAAPKIEAGQPWQPDVTKMLERWRDEMLQLPGRQMETANEFGNLAKALFEQWSPVTGPWMTMLGQATAGGHPGQAFMSGTSMMNRMMGLEEGLMPIMGGLGELPRGTVVREKMGKMLKAADALTDLRKAQAAYHRAMAEALSKAVERTIENLAERAQKDEPVESVRELMRTWFQIADQTLNEAFVSGDFLKVQEDMTSALMTYKVRQREALEVMYNALDLPTRSEVDEAYKDIHDLKREVRMLRRQLKEATEKKPAKAAASKGAKASAE